MTGGSDEAQLGGGPQQEHVRKQVRVDRVTARLEQDGRLLDESQAALQVELHDEERDATEDPRPEFGVVGARLLERLLAQRDRLGDASVVVADERADAQRLCPRGPGRRVPDRSLEDAVGLDHLGQVDEQALGSQPSATRDVGRAGQPASPGSPRDRARQRRESLHGPERPRLPRRGSGRRTRQARRRPGRGVAPGRRATCLPRPGQRARGAAPRVTRGRGPPGPSVDARTGPVRVRASGVPRRPRAAAPPRRRACPLECLECGLGGSGCQEQRVPRGSRECRDASGHQDAERFGDRQRPRRRRRVTRFG